MHLDLGLIKIKKIQREEQLRILHVDMGRYDVHSFLVLVAKENTQLLLYFACGYGEYDLGFPSTSCLRKYSISTTFLHADIEIHDDLLFFHFTNMSTPYSGKVPYPNTQHLYRILECKPLVLKKIKTQSYRKTLILVELENHRQFLLTAPLMFP